MTAGDLTERFDGRVAVVTGVGRAGQLGEAVAREFARRGARVAIIDRNAADAEARAVELRGEGYAVTAYGCDLSDVAATADVVRQIAEAHDGRIHALANVAGGFAMSGPVAESDPAILQRQLTINLGSAYGATRACLPWLRTTRGAIVFMTSAAVLPGGTVAKMWAYAAAKAGLVTLMQAVAQEERKNGVRANALAPTAIRTADNLQAMGDGVAYVERETVAAMIAYLCSDAAEAVTGQVIGLS